MANKIKLQLFKGWRSLKSHQEQRLWEGRLCGHGAARMLVAHCAVLRMPKASVGYPENCSPMTAIAPAWAKRQRFIGF